MFATRSMAPYDWELKRTRGIRTLPGDDEYLIINLEVDEDGSGSGNVAVGATIRWDPEIERIRIGIESDEPIRMTSVQKVG